jgi:pimeloyl-ACP methyl ester carboxylesterase/DNA-binding SARP family transcriptional activator
VATKSGPVIEGNEVVKNKELLHVRVLGHLFVGCRHTRVKLPPSKKTRALLAYLAVTARAHSRDRLCVMFWGVPDDPRAALRWSLSHLRPLIDDGDCRRIIADRESVGLDLSCVAVDILSLRGAVRGGIELMSTEALREAAQALEGEFLEGLDLPDCQEFAIWCAAQREETRRLRVRVLAALVARLEDVPEEALPFARTLSLLEPDNEQAHATLVRLLCATGRRSEAGGHLQRARRQLAELQVVSTGALQRVAQLSLQPDSRVHSNGGAVAPTRVEHRRAIPLSDDVQFCRTSDGVRIAHSAVGDGPPLVWAAHCLAFSSKNPIWRHWTEEFAKDHTFIHYDERGSGLSDWDNVTFSVDSFVRDLEAVVDALGLERFALIGSSKGGPTSIAYAARHPERVSHLILFGTFAEGWRVPGNSAEIERREAIITLIRQGWAQDNPAFRQILTSLLLPDATLDEMGWLNDLQRISASAENAARLQQALGDFNLLDLLSRITAPTLVLHCRDDATFPFEQGRVIASRVPGARLVALDSRNHILLPRDPAWTRFVSEVRQFLSEGATSGG